MKPHLMPEGQTSNLNASLVSPAPRSEPRPHLRPLRLRRGRTARRGSVGVLVSGASRRRLSPGDPSAGSSAWGPAVRDRQRETGCVCCVPSAPHRLTPSFRKSLSNLKKIRALLANRKQTDASLTTACSDGSNCSLCVHGAEAADLFFPPGPGRWRTVGVV